jgi:hypothetical protein
MVIGRDLDMHTAGAPVIVAGRSVNAVRSFFGIVISRKVVLEEGSQVLLNTPQALFFGAALGTAFGLISLLSKRFSRTKSK